MPKKNLKKAVKKHLELKFLIPLAIFVFTVSFIVGTQLVNAVSTKVKGHQKERYDQDGNGYSDAGVFVNGHYYSVYAYDANGDYHWDLGDGRIFGFASVDHLDQDTLTTCDYVINYRADFGNDPFMNHGWIQNLINCTGYEGTSHYNYLIVSDTDPRYTGNPDWALWGNWEYHVLTESHEGNLVKTMRNLVE